VITSLLVPLLPLLLLLVLLLLAGTCWGPGTHLEYAARVHGRRAELPERRAQLIDRQRAAYDYGNLAADIINIKAYGGHYNHCHRWTIVDEMRAYVDTDREEAFVLGYLSHLAADTIAHNHFVPYHLARYARGGKGLGHLYWELCADRFVADHHWVRVAELKRDDDLSELDELVNRTVLRKALPMRTNKLLFNHVLLVSERDSWRTQMERLLPRNRTQLEEEFLERFRAAATERVLLALSEGGVARLAHVDTNGAAAQQAALRERREGVRAKPRGPERSDEHLRRAESFLVGMESPPPSEGATPHW
jgi:hypothetical protein